MLEALITSKTRVKLLLKFFLNSDNTAYLRSLENEFGESSNAIRLELNRFEDVGLLVSSTSGNKKMYQANKSHSLFSDLHNILKKFVGIDEIIDKVLRKVGDLQSAYITGAFAKGNDSRIIDLVLVGVELNRTYISKKIEKYESVTNRRVRVLIIEPDELEYFLENNRSLIIWESGKKIKSPKNILVAK